MAAMLTRALALLAVATTAAAVAVTPIEKVTQLITDLKTEVETEGKQEATTYDEFACFCKSKTDTISSSITGGQDTIDNLAAEIEEKTATVADKTKQLGEEKVKLETLTKELEEEKVRCQKEKAIYEANEADLSKAISSLEGAQAALEGAKPAASASLFAVKATVKKSLDLAEAMKVIDQGDKWHQAVAFIQQLTKVDPDDPDYKYHSQGVIDLLMRLEEEFRANKANVDAEWGKTKKECSDIKTQLSNQIGQTKDTISTLNTDIGRLTSEIGTARGSLVQAEAQLKDDQLYIKDLTGLCEQRAKEWDQRSQQRGEELEALTKCLAVLTSKVSDADAINKRALLVEKKPAVVSEDEQPEVAAEESVASFLQTRSLRGGNAASEEAKMQVRLNNALTMLRSESSRLGSTALAAVAARAAGDPFGKVKKLIQDLVERLLKEATEEATKKGFCDTELGKAKQDRDFRLGEVKKLNAELKGLEAKEDKLKLEIDDLTTDLATLKSDLKEATKIRGLEKADNLDTISKATDGMAAVREAIMIMKSFYGKAAKAASLIQKASPVDEDTSGAGFEGNYKGKQQQSSGIVGMLEVIESDFDRTIRKTTEAENTAQAEFVEFERASKSDIAGKTTKKELDEEDLAKTQSTLKAKMEDMKDNMDLADEAFKMLEELKPTCIDTGMSYEERVAKRNEEVAALKKALCILDENDVEPLCAE